ncbi:hypothetical protein L5G32_09030 [Gordonia sp. HY002]|uniref:hypothetical protein n=1 Tax=Gordonia zhenghanii TaxID=2911516 RepID=UPI001EF12D8A|nr:hypothetical protein [Gordonia zhenghanii]MCF8570407.1 hypothetical protein [Gordonia zhenghanii]MCF8604637.1 hypothetical protein [Gordonia zhenghanii]
MTETAVKNGIPRDQFERAVTIMQEQRLDAEFVRQLYILDGQVRGYVDMGDSPSIWILGQAAHAHYDLS